MPLDFFYRYKHLSFYSNCTDCIENMHKVTEVLTNFDQSVSPSSLPFVAVFKSQLIAVHFNIKVDVLHRSLAHNPKKNLLAPFSIRKLCFQN